MKTVHLTGKLANLITLLITLPIPLLSTEADNSWSELPPPTTGKIKQQNLQYRLELVVNQYAPGLSRSSMNVKAILSLNEFGSIGLAYLDIYSFNGDKNRLLNLSWSKGLWGSNSSFYASASLDYSQNNWSFALVLQIPLNFLDSMTIDAQRNTAGQNTQRVTYSHAMPSDGTFSWNMAYAHQDSQDDYQQASLGWRNAHVQMQGGIDVSSGNYTQWGNVSGSLVIMDGTFKRLIKSTMVLY